MNDITVNKCITLKVGRRPSYKLKKILMVFTLAAIIVSDIVSVSSIRWISEGALIILSSSPYFYFLTIPFKKPNFFFAFRLYLWNMAEDNSMEVDSLDVSILQ